MAHPEVWVYIGEVSLFGDGINSFQMILPLLLCGIGMGLVMAPLADLVLTDVPQRDAGSASGLISTTQQLGTATGAALVSVVFFSFLDAGTSYAGAFQSALWWIIVALTVMFVLMFALPRQMRNSYHEGVLAAH